MLRRSPRSFFLGLGQRLESRPATHRTTTWPTRFKCFLTRGPRGNHDRRRPFPLNLCRGRCIDPAEREDSTPRRGAHDPLALLATVTYDRSKLLIEPCLGDVPPRRDGDHARGSRELPHFVVISLATRLHPGNIS